jgi:hypothetical protein
MTYLQHGRRHGPQGSDPIPGIGQVPFAAIQNASSAPSPTRRDANSTSRWRMARRALFETSDATVFENAQGSGISGDPWGIKCLAERHVHLKENYFVGGGTAASISPPTTPSPAATRSASTRPAAPRAQSATHGTGGQHGTYVLREWTDATDSNPAPIWINPYASARLRSDITVKCRRSCIYLGPYAGGNI